MNRYKKFLENCKTIEKYYNYLICLTNNHNFVGPTNEWIIDNYYIVVELKETIKKRLKEDKKIKEVINQPLDFFTTLNKMCYANNFNIRYEDILKVSEYYQNREEKYLSYKVLEAIPIEVSFVIIERLSKLCSDKKESQEAKQKIRDLVSNLEDKLILGEEINLKEYITFDKEIGEHPEIIEQLNDSLKELGSVSNNLFVQLNTMLEEYNLVLKDLINKEHIDSINNNILISNIFNSLREIFKIKTDNLFDKLSKTEKVLKQDLCYKKMTGETKSLYRNIIIKNSKGTSEYKYACKLLEKSKLNDKHIGFYLQKKINYSLRSRIYILLIVVLTILISAFLAKITFKLFWLAFILLLIPISEVVIQLTNRIMLKFNPCQPLPKMDFSKGIDKNNATMVVIPTIVKSREKIDDMFSALEKYYLANKSENLYFTLLGDCSESKTQKTTYDDEIAIYGIKKSNELNSKYNQKIFSFVYRKRIFSEGEDKYLGYERKRGALIHLNKLLLHKMTKSEYDDFIYVENVKEISSEIKFVITIDTDTELVLNTALSLTGVMAHPLNKPVLNKKKNKVISGYGIIQPRVNVDIESTNKSIYSQIMAGIGGFDIYSSIVPNFYQDVFGEGSFVGKGIYDLKTFDEILSNTIPENLVLSHDLLEGNYLRCGYASDIEVIDDFPSEFVVESSRQHRWARGDVQILGWLKKKVKDKKGSKVKNPLNLIEKFKIFDNVRRIFINPCMLLLLVLSFIFGNPFLVFITILMVIFLPMLFYLKELLHIQNRKIFTFKYYNNLMYGFFSILYRVFISLATLPYYSYLYLDAFSRSIYRMTISHKKLLNWLTAEDAAKTLKKDLSAYLKQFWFNYVISLLLIVISLLFAKEYLLIAIIATASFVSAPFVLWYFSIRKDVELTGLSERQNQKMEDIAHKTWLYFSKFLTKENNYLIPDNYQLNRENREDVKTSPTDIGMSITSVVCASELEFINVKTSLDLLKNIITTIEKLEKWNGHLYNWYNIKTLNKIVPYVISSVDSGNFAASLIVAKEYCLKHKDLDLYNRISNLFDAMNFTKLYTKQDVFSIAYDTVTDELSIYNYNKFASESRILSYIAIMKGDAPSKHWLCLDKTLTKYKKHKGLVSWSGTSFEYFMPLIFMKTYPNTLLDESYFFSKFCQKSYMNEIDPRMPWGISESAYDELDDGLNYKYKAFATPYLKVIDEKEERLVISPYASILTVTTNPIDVYLNLKKFKRLNMYGEFGLYESYDYTTSNRVLAYYAHHQGMILASLTNYLKDNVIQRYFHSDLRAQAFEILLKEKVQLNPVIDMKIVGYKKYNYEKEKIVNDIREYNYISDIPQLSVLSNSHYTVLINDRGNGFSRYNTTQLNRYRKITEQEYGSYMYIKDLNTNNIWSNTYAPTNVTPDKYNVVFANDRIKFLRLDNQVSTQTEVIVMKDQSAEIRKVTFKNNSDTVKKLELTTYTEVILEENIDDIIHRTFKNLFVSSKYDIENDSLILCRRNNSKNTSDYMFGKLLVENSQYQNSYETEREHFIGRGHNLYDAIALNKNLSNETGSNIDPILSIRTVIDIEPKKEKTVYYIQGFSKSLEGINKILDNCLTVSQIERAFEYSSLANSMTAKLLGIDGTSIRTYNIMLNYLYQTSRHFINDDRKRLLAKNTLNQSNLWKFGISGDRPIVLVDISNGEDSHLAKDSIRAFEYFKSMGIFIDLVIINSETEEYKQIVRKEVEQEIYRSNKLFDFNNTPGSIHVIDSDSLSYEEKILLNMVARLSFKSDRDSSLSDAVNKMHLENKMVNYKTIKPEPLIDFDIDTTKINKFNGYGGFINNGKEYIITDQNTPTPWSNVIANERFGTIVTNNGCGFTYAYNSQMFKLTSWTNDIVVNDKSEGITVNDKEVRTAICRHGFGYSIFEYDGKDYNLETVQFVARKDAIKFYKNKITNISNSKKRYKISFWINPTMGPNEEKSSRYLLSEFNNNVNSILVRNVYSINFSNVYLFMSSTLPIKKYSVDKILFKSITIELELDSNESKEFSFMLGAEVNIDEIKELTTKYDNLEVNKEYEKIKNYWKDVLGRVKIKTPDDSFNIMMNGWYLYQTISSRLFAKAGFYQVGGAYGFRDQLQDATNICEISPEITKRQILNNANHQFREGDVLHWWHEINRFGLRSRYKDDYLWLVYATNRYIKVTGDIKILDEIVSFVTGDSLKPNEEERGMNYTYTNEKSSLLEHIILSINRTIEYTGDNGLPLIGGGDWNDGMNKVGILGKGTSVWLGFFAYMTIRDFMDICDDYNIKINKSLYINYLVKLKEHLNKVAWDGEYYLRAFYDNGNKLGSKNNNECKIDLISQSFSILSDIIPFDRIGSVIKSVEDNLVDRNLKIIKLLDPPFKNTKDIPGYIMDYPKGIRENGGQYTHSTAWYIMALIKAGHIDRAYSYYQMINPVNRTLTNEKVTEYKIEPYVIAADIYSNYRYPARGGWSWYTGSAGWYYHVGLKDIIGFTIEDNYLRLEPNVSSSWKNYELEYKYMETLYKIKVNLKENRNSIMLDGEKVNSNSIKLKNDKRIHAVIINLKGGSSDD